ncbi:MAG: UbiA family prenyltransferase [Candidatus Bathyarchaeota archaeon]|nr:UbiA family prenyltransferase [Candidatus Bathyarchaeota archaeon]
MIGSIKGFAQFISVERGFMLLMISIGATFLIGENVTWVQAIYLSVVAFCGWSAVDSINNICDADLDAKSDPSRSEYTRRLGRRGLYISILFSVLSVCLGVITRIPLVIVLILAGLLAGVLYSVSPFRLRQTLYKPLVNFSVGAVPVLITAAFFNIFSVEVWVLMLLIGATTAVNSLWEDLADYSSDLSTHSRTMLIVLGLKRGLLATVVLGYCLVPLMVLVGTLFHLNLLYYLVLAALTAYMSLRLILERSVLFEHSEGKTEPLLNLGTLFARDFVIMAIIQTTNLMLSGYLRYYSPLH